MPPEIRILDPLIEGCEALTAQHGITPELGYALSAWVEPTFENLPPVFPGRDGLLLAAACRLADLGARLHPDHRADIAFDQVLRAPLAGMNHPERVFLAYVAFARHSASPFPADDTRIGRVLSPERRQRAKALGAAIRLGCDLSGRNTRLLEKTSLSIKGDRLALTVLAGWEDILLGEQTARRAQTLAQALKLKLAMN